MGEDLVHDPLAVGRLPGPPRGQSAEVDAWVEQGAGSLEVLGGERLGEPPAGVIRVVQSRANLALPLELEEGPLGTEVADRRLADRRARAPALVDVAADGQARALLLDRLEDGGAAEVVAGARLVDVAVGR